MNKGQRLGYRRVSTVDQRLDRQLDGLELDRIFEDKCSGKATARPGLQALLEFAREGDQVFVHSLDRLGRNLDDLRRLVQQLTGKGITVHFQKEALVFGGEDRPLAQLLLSVMGAFAEFERSIILERQREGIALAKARGAYKGRRPSLSPGQVAEARIAILRGVPKAKVARDIGVSRQTLYSYIRNSKITQTS